MTVRKASLFRFPMALVALGLLAATPLDARATAGGDGGGDGGGGIQSNPAVTPPQGFDPPGKGPPGGPPQYHWIGFDVRVETFGPRNYFPFQWVEYRWVGFDVRIEVGAEAAWGY